MAGALRILPEVKLEGMLGGSITIECPLPQMHVRLYLCREMAESGGCATVVSNKNFVKEEYKHRVTLKPCPDKNLFLVEVTELTKSDSGVYACGTGMKTDRGKTQLVTLTVYSGRCPQLSAPSKCLHPGRLGQPSNYSSPPDSRAITILASPKIIGICVVEISQSPKFPVQTI